MQKGWLRITKRVLAVNSLFLHAIAIKVFNRHAVSQLDGLS